MDDGTMVSTDDAMALIRATDADPRGTVLMLLRVLGGGLATATRERDEARAEAERLRARLHRCACCGVEESALAACEGDEYPLCGPCAASALREAHVRLAEMRADRDALKGALSRANELRIGDRAEARLGEREACAAMLDERAREIPVCSCCGSGEDRRAEEELRAQARAIRARRAGGGV